jgi:hypothetical protein
VIAGTAKRTDAIVPDGAGRLLSRMVARYDSPIDDEDALCDVCAEYPEEGPGVLLQT